MHIIILYYTSYITYIVLYTGQSSVNDHYNIEQFLLYDGYTRVETLLIQLCSPSSTTNTTPTPTDTKVQLQLQHENVYPKRSEEEIRELQIRIFTCFGYIHTSLTYYILYTNKTTTTTPTLTNTPTSPTTTTNTTTNNKTTTTPTPTTLTPTTTTTNTPTTAPTININTLITQEKILILGQIFVSFLGRQLDLTLCESILKVIINISETLRHTTPTSTTLATYTGTTTDTTNSNDTSTTTTNNTITTTTTSNNNNSNNSNILLYELFLSHKDNTYNSNSNNSNSDINLPIITYLKLIGRKEIFRLVYYICVYMYIYILYSVYMYICYVLLYV